MSTGEIIEQLRAMPQAERRELVGEIWREFADSDYTLTAKQAAELDQRLADHKARPDDVVSWSAIKAATKTKYDPSS